MARRTAEEAPEMTDAELAEMRPVREVHSAKEFAALTAVRRRGRPKAEKPKVAVTIRLEAETAAKFRASGARWQSRVSDLLTHVATEGDATAWVRPASAGCAMSFKFPKRAGKAAESAKAKARA